jgi:hypothetical protein
VFFDIAPQGAMSKKIPTGEFSIDFFEELSFDLDSTGKVPQGYETICMLPSFLRKAT